MENKFDFSVALFDMDGTLLDSMKYWKEVADDYLKSLSITPPITLWNDIRCLTMEQSAKYLKKYFLPSYSISSIIDGCNTIIEENYKNKVKAKPSVREYLLKLKGMNIPICICTTTDRYLVEIVMKRLGLLSFFENIFTCSDVGESKNESAKVYNMALDYINSNTIGKIYRPQDCCVFEDVGFAAKVAKGAGYKVVGIIDEHSKEDESILNRYCDRVVRDFDELI